MASWEHDIQAHIASNQSSEIPSDGLSTRQEKQVITVSEYRKILNDFEGNDEQIIKKIAFLESFSRKVIGIQLRGLTNKQYDEEQGTKESITNTNN